MILPIAFCIIDDVLPISIQTATKLTAFFTISINMSFFLIVYGVLLYLLRCTGFPLVALE